MTLTLTLTPEKETQLAAQARRAGLSLDEYALRVLGGDDRDADLPTEAAPPEARPGDQGTGAEEQVLRLYRAGAGAPVRQFLRTRPDVAALLLEAWPPIQRVFGDGTQVTLRMITDHESGGDVVVAARVQVPGTVTEALAGRKRFNREWWMGRPESLTGPVQFDVEIA